MPIETKRYMILLEGNEYPIIMPNIYSTEKFEKEFTYSGSDLGATYTPENYNVPEGSYSTDPYNGAVRVSEMKQMVKTLHDNQISVIMDVVYNHVYNASDFCVNQIVPGYFSRVDADGKYSNGSDCGNDTASERSMVRKYIVDSVKYWADEYHIDGFRFDLVGLIDTETINEVVTEVHKTHPDVIFYGEGWTMDTAVTKDGYKMTTQPNSTDVPGFAFFSDTLRDALKGHVFYTTRKGYVSGAADLADTVKGCFLGQADDWCTTPSQSINYASCHDNMTLLDRITKSTPGASRRGPHPHEQSLCRHLHDRTGHSIPAGRRRNAPHQDRCLRRFCGKQLQFPGFCQQYQMGYVRR